MHHHAQSSRRRWPKRGWSGTRGAGPSGTAVGAVEEAETAHGAVVEAGATRGRNLGGTVRAERGAASGSNPGGTFGAGWQGATVPAMVSRVPTVETVEPDSQRKSRLVGLGEAPRGKLSSSKTTCRKTIKRFVERSRQR
jgi:hypothetical protein